MLINTIANEHKLLCGGCKHYGNEHAINVAQLCSYCYNRVMKAHAKALSNRYKEMFLSYWE